MTNTDAAIVLSEEESEETTVQTTIIEPFAAIKVIRGEQVILDSDLATLYGVETRVLNQAVKRNETRFPKRYRFQLSQEELNDLRSQNVTSNGWGGRRTLPYAFTESGVAMLSSILKSDTAVEISIRIIDSFIAMRKMLVANTTLSERITAIEVRQLEYQKMVDEKLDRVFGYFENEKELPSKVFFDGQVFDALVAFAEIVKEADSSIILIDGYVDLGTLNILLKKKSSVYVRIYTTKRGDKLTENDLSLFRSQYGQIDVTHTNAFHDRFLILDNKKAFHIGASMKDAGKKVFAITELQDKETIENLLNRV